MNRWLCFVLPADCGGEIQVSRDGSPSYITSPGYSSTEDNGYYDNHQECNWRVTAPSGYQVELEFVDDFSVYCHYASQCNHWVEVKYNRKSMNTGAQGAR